MGGGAGGRAVDSRAAAGRGPAALTLLVAFGLAQAVGGPLSFIVTLCAWGWLGLPGVIWLGPGRPVSQVRVAVGLLAGVAASLVTTAAAGSLLGWWGLPLGLGVPATLSAAAWLARRRPAGGEREPAAPVDGEGWPLHLPLVFTLAIIALPLVSFGLEVSGHRVYSPFFCADLFKHMAQTQAVLHGQLPPVDIWGGDGPLRYYWLSYLIPATAMAMLGEAAHAGEVVLTSGIFGTLLLITALYGACARLQVRPWGAGAGGGRGGGPQTT